MSVIRLAWVSGGLVWVLAGCHREAGPTSELERAFQESPAAAAELAPRTKELPPPNIFMREAVTAMKTNGYIEALAPLQALRSHPGLNADQLLAVQDAMSAVQMELARRADRGDVRAQQALHMLGMMRRRAR